MAHKREKRVQPLEGRNHLVRLENLSQVLQSEKESQVLAILSSHRPNTDEDQIQGLERGRYQKASHY